MPWIDHAHSQRSQPIPALFDGVTGALIDEAWWRQIAGKGHSLVQNQRHAVIGVAGCPDNLARNPDAVKADLLLTQIAGEN
jgi:hypothetical protein